MVTFNTIRKKGLLLNTDMFWWVLMFGKGWSMEFIRFIYILYL